jgi:hypothetical protein
MDKVKKIGKEGWHPEPKEGWRSEYKGINKVVRQVQDRSSITQCVVLTVPRCVGGTSR